MERAGGGSFMRSSRSLESFLNTNSSPNVEEENHEFVVKEELKNPEAVKAFVFKDGGWVAELISFVRIVTCFVVMMVTTSIWAIIMVLLLPWPCGARLLLQMWIVGNEVKIEGAEFSNQRAIYISNHASPIDILLMMWLITTDTVGIAEKEVSTLITKTALSQY
ncbi:unnamed protein product [Linum tenue]|uniref:Phospholipid/glycerol acyltransferase domain-containing protein n=1 Tax=Linum tenue TaxID=586396 RepID=A0AAV0H3D2_9ROSI|nr:unnamed protein product [Linum tenue]